MFFKSIQTPTFIASFALLAFGILGFGANDAAAFPELIRHGYSNCVTCHANPGGGGVLNAYGREISKEALSTWSSETESELAWGAIKTPEWLAATVMARSLSFIRDTRTTIDGRTLLMQLDAEASAQSEKWGLVAAAGIQNPRGGPTGTQSPLAARRLFGQYRPTDTLAFRAGFFQPVYGLMPADHRIAIRSGLGWDQGNETWNLEGAYIGEQWNVFATGIIGRPGQPDFERGGALSVSHFFADRYKIGVNGYFGEAPDTNAMRAVFGPHAMLAFTSRLYWLGELDFQNQNSTWGVFQYQKLGFEPVQGFHVFLAQDFQQANSTDTATSTWAWGPGLQWFPRPHFEGQLFLWQNRYPSALQDLNQTTVYAMLNFYL